MNDRDRRACLVCGTPLPLNVGFCPVCRLRGALGSEAASEGGLPDEGQSQPEEGCFDHYALVRRPDGASFAELGRGAMGVTYRAIDTILGCPVALKALEARIATHPEARERFLREARAAARLRHPKCWPASRPSAAPGPR